MVVAADRDDGERRFAVDERLNDRVHSSVAARGDEETAVRMQPLADDSCHIHPSLQIDDFDAGVNGRGAQAFALRVRQPHPRGKIQKHRGVQHVRIMKKVAILFLSLQFLILGAAHAATAPKECTICVGAVGGAATVPTLQRVTALDDSIDQLTPEQRAKAIVLVPMKVDGSSLTDIETQTAAIVDWGKKHGPFNAIGLTFEATDSATAAYAVKRLAVAAQGQNVASRIAMEVSRDTLTKLFDAGAQAYFDALIVDAANVADTAKWLAEKDPAKKIIAVVTPQSPNVFFDLSRALADGASLALLNDGQAGAPTLQALANFNQMLSGDYAYDPTSKIDVLDARGQHVEMPVITFVRGEDLRTIVVPRGDANGPFIVSLPTDRFTRPRRVDAAGDREVKDVGAKGGRYLIGAQAVKAPFAFTVDHAEKPEVAKEAISVATERGITGEEIIRNHQAYKSFQESIQPRYIALDATKLRFQLEGGEAIEATISGDYFSEPHGRSDWVWQNFYINGVKWKYGKIPELPLIQPERVTQLPLDIHLTNEYRYQLVREVDVDGYHTYEVRFEPPPNAPAALPLYRGTVWIDAHTWSRIRITMIQLNLSGEVLSNEERVDFQPFAADSHAPLSAADVAKADPRSILWLPREVSAQQVVSAAGRANVILRSTEFSHFRIDPSDFDAALKEASASDARMVRETQAGLRYLEKTPGGDRVLKEGFNTARTFALAGVHHDAGLDYPVVPLGGIDYFNFDLAHKGIQTNVFFAGLVLAADATQPSFRGTKTNVGVDFFAIALPTTSSIYRNGIEQKNEAVKTVPASMSFRVGHPFAQFGKIDFTMQVAHRTYERADDTAPDFIVPADTFELSPSVDGSYSRWGYTIDGFFDYTHRTTWKPWGNLA